MEKQNSAYLLFNESLDSGLIQGQVFSLLKDLAKKQKHIYIFYFFCFFKMLSLKKIRQLNKELKNDNLTIVPFPITLPARFFLFTPLYPLMAFFYAILTVLFVARLKVSILHARSYFPALIGSIYKKLGLKIELVFDTRSLFVDENVYSKKINDGGLTYKMWRLTEKYLLREADKVVVVADAFLNFYQNYIPCSKIIVIPICVDENVIYFNPQARENIRNKFNLQDRKVLIYSGSFYAWNNPSLYAKFFSCLKEKIPSLFFLIITVDQSKIKKQLQLYGFSTNDYHIISCAYEQIGKYLSAGDYGLFVMDPVPDSKTRLGVKFLEYLAVGLTPIVNNNVGAAAAVVKSSKLGYIIGLNEFQSTHIEFELQDRKKISSYFLDNFSKVKVTKKYNDLYDELHKNANET